MKQKSSILGVVYAIISSATFGLIPLFSIPLLKAGIGSPTILFYRFMVAAAMMALIMAVTRRKFRLRKEQLWVVTLLAVLYALTAILLLSSYQDIPSGMATTIHFLYPQSYCRRKRQNTCCDKCSQNIKTNGQSSVFCFQRIWRKFV